MEEVTTDITEISDEDIGVSLLERVDIIPQVIIDAYKGLGSTIKNMTEDQLRNRFRYTMTDERLRVSFWKQLNNSIKTGKQLKLSTVAHGICNMNILYNVIHNPDKFCWLIQPVVPYETRTKALLDKATSRYNEILDMDITKVTKVKEIDNNGNVIMENGEPKTKYIKEIAIARAKLLLDTIKHLEERVKGLAVQKSINVNETARKGESVVAHDMDAINSKLEELQEKLGVNKKEDTVEVEYKEIDDDK